MGINILISSVTIATYKIWDILKKEEHMSKVEKRLLVNKKIF